MHQGLKKLISFALLFILIIIFPNSGSETIKTRAPPPDPGSEPGIYPINETTLTFYDREGNGIDAMLYFPEPNDVPYPTIVFGEDYDDKGSVSLSSYDWIGRNIAKWGYNVLIPAYTNNTPLGYQGFDNHWLWVNQTYDSINYLIENCSYCEVDEDRIALMGHGGGGSLSIIEASIDKRVKCVIALSPIDRYVVDLLTYNPPYPTDWVNYLTPVPLQIQVGRGTGIILLPGGHEEVYSRPIYEAANAPKELVILNRGNHYSFMDNTLPTNQRNVSLRHSISFLNYYLKNDENFYDYVIDEYSSGIVSSVTEFQGLDSIIQDWNINYQGLNSPFEIDLKYGDGIVHVYTNITPRGIGWGDSIVEIEITPPMGDPVDKKLSYIDDYNTDAGYYYTNFKIELLSPLGDYNTQIKVEDSNGIIKMSDEKSFTIMSSAKQPVAKLEATPIIAEAGDLVTFNATKSFDLDDINIVAFNFSFGDGNYTGWISDSYKTHNYKESGLYLASVIVKNELGAESDESDKVKIIIDKIPKAKIDSNLSEIFVNETIAFDANDSYDNDGEIVEYFFDFGDGENSSWTNKAYIIHKYMKIGTFDARVKVKDDVGAESDWSKILTIIVEKSEEENNNGIDGESSSSGFNFIWLIFLILAFILIIGGGLLIRVIKHNDGEEEDEAKTTEPDSEGDSELSVDKKTLDNEKNIPSQIVEKAKDKEEKIKNKESEFSPPEPTQKEVVEEKEMQTLKEEEKYTEIEEDKIEDDKIISTDIETEDEIEWDEEESITIKEEKRVIYKKGRKPKKKSPFLNIPIISGKKANVKPKKFGKPRSIYPGYKLNKIPQKPIYKQNQQPVQQPVMQQNYQARQTPQINHNEQRYNPPQYQQPQRQPSPSQYHQHRKPTKARQPSYPVHQSRIQPNQVGGKGRKKAIFHSKAVFVPKEPLPTNQRVYQKPLPPQPLEMIEEEIKDEIDWEEEKEQKGLVRPLYKKEQRTYDDFNFADIEIDIPKKNIDSKSKKD